MQRHPFFDLWLHEADELSETIGCPVTGRVTLHEWPLSCVQRLECADGRTYIYKVQARPTVEPEFYRKARSPLLVKSSHLPIAGMPDALLLEDVQQPCLSDLGLSAEEALQAADAVLAQIARIEGDLPALADIRTAALWLEYAQTILANVRALAAAGSFQRVGPATIQCIADHCRSDAVLAAVTAGPTGYVHADLCAENILVQDHGYKVLDWQRPIWGPASLDLATLLTSLNLRAEDYVPSGVVRLRALLLIDWLAQAARFWFPPGAATYDEQIERLAQQLDR